jgi:hypothetical protein
MKTFRWLWRGVAAIAMGSAAFLAVVGKAQVAEGQAPSPIQDGKLGFVVANISYGLSNSTNPAEICPSGASLGPREIFVSTPEGRRQPNEADADYATRLRAGAQAVATAANGQNLCMNPEASGPDPHFRTVSSSVRVSGMDLDGQDSRASGRPAPGTCAHNDFRGVNGGQGIDNQFFRAVGCTNTFLPGGHANGFATEMLTGSWGILLALEDVQDLRNDDSVTVRFYANADPIQLSASREPLVNVTYAVDADPRYHATARGRIVNGVLTSEPTDVRFHMTLNGMHLDRPMRDARVRMTINSDGSMEGVMAGYSPVEEMYDLVFGFRSGRNDAGELASIRARQGSSNGYAFTAQHTCHGAYHAMRQMADGHPDPATGECTSLSTQYLIRAVPAFVVNAETHSVNEDLAAGSQR